MPIQQLHQGLHQLRVELLIVKPTQVQLLQPQMEPVTTTTYPIPSHSLILETHPCISHMQKDPL